MRSIFSLLFIGMMVCTSILRADCSSSSSEESSSSSLSSLFFAFGDASVPAKPRSKFPLSQQVQLTELNVSSKNVSLTNGSLKLPPGVYRLSYSVDLQNTGKSGSITTWLTIQNSHLEPPVIIPFTIGGSTISAACEQGFSIVHVTEGTNFDIVLETSLISLNYSTTGDVRLSTLPFFKPCCRNSKKEGLPPNPFHLSAVQFFKNEKP